MGDDLLGDILRRTTGEGPERPAADGAIGDLLGRAVSRPLHPAVGAETPDLAPLAALDAAGAAALLRYLPADLVVPLLARAPVAVQDRLVRAMDADARAWLQAQSDELEAVGPARHVAAAAKALTLLQRLREDGRIGAPAPGAPAAPPSAPLQVSASIGAGPAAAAVIGAPPAVGAPPSRPADPLVDLLAELIDAARSRRPGELRQLAAGLDHPVLAEGLRLVAAGCDPHDLDAALRAAAADHLAAEERRLELIRQALLAIRFGDDAARFRATAR